MLNVFKYLFSSHSTGERKENKALQFHFNALPNKIAPCFFRVDFSKVALEIIQKSANFLFTHDDERDFVSITGTFGLCIM